MKATFHHRPVNGPFEDTSLYVYFMHERRSVLFDAGELAGLSNGDIMRLSDVFISHTHIDHFIGFDALLRVVLKREQPLRVYGPAIIIDAVEGKLSGYTWNKIRDYPVKLDVFAIEPDRMRHAGFYAENGFKRLDMPALPFDGPVSGILRDEPGCTIKSLRLDHEIDSLGYSIEEEAHVNINKLMLGGMGLPVGPWLKDLKRAVHEGADDGVSFMVEGRSVRLGEMRPALVISEGQRVCYITDCNPTEDNIRRIIEFSRGATTLYLEATFLGEDIDRAIERNHLTGRIAGTIAREAGVKWFVPMHVSTRYMDKPYNPVDEAMEVFRSGIVGPE